MNTHACVHTQQSTCSSDYLPSQPPDIIIITQMLSTGGEGVNQTTHTHTHPLNGSFSGTTQVSRYEKGKTNLDFTEARDSEWQWHQLGHMQVSTLLQTDNHTSTPPLSFLQAWCPSCRPTNSVKALKEKLVNLWSELMITWVVTCNHLPYHLIP